MVSEKPAMLFKKGHGATIRRVLEVKTESARIKRDRLFYTAAGAIFLMLTVTGFRHYRSGDDTEE
jgi:hypothetical protein